MRIAVAGGSGCVGRFVVEASRAAGHLPVVLARSAGVNIVTGAGLDAALQGVDAVIDVTNSDSVTRSRSVAFFEAGTRNLQAAGRRAGVSHHVVLSIVGIDRVDLGYYEGKRRQEEIVLSGSLPASVVRSTQFHEFAAQMCARSAGPVAFIPTMRCQPVAAREVAEALVETAVGEPVGLAADHGGPAPAEMTDLARQLLRARRSRRLVMPVWLPGAAGKAMAGGGLLPTGGGPRGRLTFTEWLASADGTYLNGH